MVMAVAMATMTKMTRVAITAAAGEEASRQVITPKPAGTSAPTATDWKLSVKREMVTGAGHHWTILTSARALSPMTMGIWYVVVVVTTMAATVLATITVDGEAARLPELIPRPAAISA